jgi:hypothetical protein
MNMTSSLIRFSAAAVLAGAMSGALGANISAIQPGAATVSLDRGAALVRFTISGSAEARDHCGYFVDYGDGAAGDSRVIDNENGQFNRAHERTFTRPGTYTIRATGKNVKTTSGCNGGATTTLTVVSGPVASSFTQPTCPEGWMLNERSVNRRTGAFSCTAKPAGTLECPDGLRYYERDGVIGCRPGRRDR